MKLEIIFATVLIYKLFIKFKIDISRAILNVKRTALRDAHAPGGPTGIKGPRFFTKPLLSSVSSGNQRKVSLSLLNYFKATRRSGKFVPW